LHQAPALRRGFSTRLSRLSYAKAGCFFEQIEINGELINNTT
jgi:hypothetical protein